MKSQIERMADEFAEKAKSQGWTHASAHTEWGSGFAMVYLEDIVNDERVMIALLTDIQFKKFSFSHLVLEKEESSRVYKDGKYFKKYKEKIEKLFEN